ncbi:ATP-binding protein [Kitasatospora sp. GAS204B]|uniref:ATP-binding protein n=1 Tax=unclassified Kitasatospora TaxID=2633591 RepID=UPI002476901B|nr:ATP-binding protein [Kitasatospora sp. GAS204B]MDH6122898.1 anti-sigma regulatory factor (Ser/Thr protein kinase) [Kitasatospora sp. GAS204B]
MPKVHQLASPDDELDSLQISWPVVPTEASVKETRDRVGGELRAWGYRLTSDKESEIKLIVSELVTNALVHAPRHDIGFAMWIYKPGQLVVEVQDRGAHAPVAHAGMDEDTFGRGMTLVEGLALSWGVGYPGSGKCVYATIAITDAALGAPRSA